MTHRRLRASTTRFRSRPRSTKTRLKSLQKRLLRLENNMYQARIPLMVMYEGWDAAGKGGNIKRVAQSLDARAYTIFPVPAPRRPRPRAPALVALLDAPAEGRPCGHLRSQLVRSRACGAGGGLCLARAPHPGVRRDQRFRERPGRLGCHPSEILGGGQPRRAAPPFRGATVQPRQAVEDHRRRLAQPGRSIPSTRKLSRTCSA